MKKHFLLVMLAGFSATASFAQSFAGPLRDIKNKPKPAISFTENKGQVNDQDLKPRADVLYGAMAGNMAVHIKKSGVSYQLYRSDSYKEVTDIRTKEMKREPDQRTIYRIDLGWMDHNTSFTTTEDETLPGYSNYYKENCANGALHVKSYSGVRLNNLYQGIDLHYYEKSGELKHDYIVAPHADYKQIRLKVEGAEIKLNDDGSLLLITPLGRVQEGAPLVYQAGRQLKAKWLVEDNILSFEIEGHTTGIELVIDPVTRIWGTYCGDQGNDEGRSCTTDANGNSYMSGVTTSPTSTLMATTGAHQSTYGGGSSNDAFLAKYSSGGARLWATYYGGFGNEVGYSCATDASGNVYMCGETTTTWGSPIIATAAAHQTVLAGRDAYLVKFDANGIRLWGTYYGSINDEYGFACATDLTGNVYLAGVSVLNHPGGTAVATVGSHQSAPVFTGGHNDAFLVKFDANGVRLWGTYYGGSGNDMVNSCTTDAAGNVYMAGSTRSSGGTYIATVGSHQPAFSGGNWEDAYLVKFDANGVRQWGTYYGGGVYDDQGFSCATDAAGNVYLAGIAGTNTGTIIATVSSHQPTSAGYYDGFLAKFNAGGVRQWGTYYGGTGDDWGYCCATDATGNVYLGGWTATSGGTAIATPVSHQPIFGSGFLNGGDGYAAKFNSNGVRQWGTYYGGAVNDKVYSCTVSPDGHLFLAGFSSSASDIASAGHQNTYSGAGTDAFLAKFDVCDLAPSQPLALNGPTLVCAGTPANYTVALTYGAAFYMMNVPGGSPISSNGTTISVTPVSTGIFTLVASSACGASPQQTIHVTVQPAPQLTVNSGAVCLGQSFTLVAGGAATYTYSGGSVVTPTVNSFYTVSGTNTLGCSKSVVTSVLVNANPTVSVNSGTLCQGGSFTIVPSGASTYTIEGGSAVVSPNATTSYTVTGKSVPGCLSTNVAVSNVAVYPSPTINATSTHSVLCAGELATLTASGANNFTYVTIGAVAIITIAPVSTTDYTLIGKYNNGCRTTTIVTQVVDACTGISGHSDPGSGIKLYPNPTNGIITIELNSDMEISMVNATGQQVYAFKLSSGVHKLEMENLANGVYLLKAANKEGSTTLKVIKNE